MKIFPVAICIALLYGASVAVHAQTPFNISVTNADAGEVMQGNYTPSDYFPSQIINQPEKIVCTLQENISTDSLHSYLKKLSSFHNRNTYSDTASGSIGIGAARRWVYGMFQQFSQQNENRLLASYLQFDMPGNTRCGAGQFRNIFAVLPGADTSDKSIVIIEAHIDSRCEDVCNPSCLAHGADDNGSGTALVLELARVMSRFSFRRTIVFLITVGEEQGLFGAEAFAKYCTDNNIAIHAVQNNDIVGGIICGERVSQPGCIVESDIDSTQVRIFSFGNINSPHKSLARFIKMMYEEWLLPVAAVPMTVSIMQPEDRSGRGGDHIPFRQKGFTAVRFTSANEHGDGNPEDSTYHDRQHSVRDVLGFDTDGDSIDDIFFVDFNYLKRNTVINGTSAAMAALGPKTPSIQINTAGTFPVVQITDNEYWMHYRLAIRTNDVYFNTVVTLKDSLHHVIPKLQGGIVNRICVASVDANGIMSQFSNEATITNSANTTSLPADTLTYRAMNCNAYGIITAHKHSDLISLSNFPNPFSEASTLSIDFQKIISCKNMQLVISDMMGNNIISLPVALNKKNIRMHFINENLTQGIYFTTLLIDGKPVKTGRMVVL